MIENPIPLVNLVDKSFDAERMLDYDLVVQVAGNSCAWSLYDHGSNRYIGIESHDVPLEKAAEKTGWLAIPARSSVVIIQNERSTLVPDALFEESRKEAYFGLMMEKQEDEEVFHDNIKPLGIVNVYGVDNGIYRNIRRLIPAARICHVSTVLIGTTWMNYKNLITGEKIFVSVNDGTFQLLVFEKGRLLYSNAFRFMADEDFLYYLIFVMEQLGLNPEETPLTLSGNIVKDSTLFALIYKYIRNVDFVTRADSLQYARVLDEIPGHWFWTLLNPVSCEL